MCHEIHGTKLCHGFRATSSWHEIVARFRATNSCKEFPATNSWHKSRGTEFATATSGREAKLTPTGQK